MNCQDTMDDLRVVEKGFADIVKRIEILEAQLEALDKAKEEVEADSEFAQEMIDKGVNAEAVFEWLKSRDYGIETE